MARLTGAAARAVAVGSLSASACVGWSGPPDAVRALASYKDEHYAAIPAHYAGTADWPRLWTRLARCRLLVVGDDHGDRALHGPVLRLLAGALAIRAPAVLLVEFVGPRDEAAVASYLDGASDLAALRAAVRRRWPGSWLDQSHLDGAFYRAVLAAARRAHARVVPLEPIPRRPLDRRDRIMAETIARTRLAAPTALLVVLVGHTHLLGRGHLLDRLREDGGSLAILPRAGPATIGAIRRQAGRDLSRDPFLRLGDDLWLVAPSAADSATNVSGAAAR